METKIALALKALAAAGIAQELCNEIQAIHEQNLAIAKEQTVATGRELIAQQIKLLPNFLGVDLDNEALTRLVTEFLE